MSLRIVGVDDHIDPNIPCHCEHRRCVAIRFPKPPLPKGRGTALAVEGYKRIFRLPLVAQDDRESTNPYVISTDRRERRNPPPKGEGRFRGRQDHIQQQQPPFLDGARDRPRTKQQTRDSFVPYPSRYTRLSIKKLRRKVSNGI